MTSGPVLYLIACAAGPASHIDRLVQQAATRGWDVCLIPTPNAMTFIDVAAIEARSGHPGRCRHHNPGEIQNPTADAIAVVPATYNTINKRAAGVMDNYPLGLLAELIPLGVPAAVLPFVNSALAANPVFDRSIRYLRDLGVRVLYGPGEFEPHPPGTGGSRIDTYPWHLPLDAIDQLRCT